MNMHFKWEKTQQILVACKLEMNLMKTIDELNYRSLKKYIFDKTIREWLFRFDFIFSSQFLMHFFSLSFCCFSVLLLVNPFQSHRLKYYSIFNDDSNGSLSFNITFSFSFVHIDVMWSIFSLNYALVALFKVATIERNG